MGALSVWRETAAQPTRPSSPSSLAVNPKASFSQPSLAHSRGSSWALWWSRSRSERDLLVAPNPPPQPSMTPTPTDKLPALAASASQPIQASDLSCFEYIFMYLFQLIHTMNRHPSSLSQSWHLHLRNHTPLHLLPKQSLPIRGGLITQKLFG